MTREESTFLAQMVGRLRAVSTRPSDAVPAVLYHYTSGAGLLGIVRGHTLRASSFRYLNDSTEVQYGLDLIRKLLKGRGAGSASPSFVHEVQEVTSRVLESVRNLPIEFFLACFCEQGDMLSQWRAYGAPTGRFCIGFVPERFAVGTEPQRVIYDQADQEARASHVIGVVHEALAKAESSLGAPLSDDFQDEIGSNLLYRLVSWACAFKDSGFAEEREWRVVHQLDLRPVPDRVEFEAAGGALRPYINLIVPAPPETRLPIAEVIVGPSSNPPEQQVHLARLVLARYGYESVRVTSSEVPFRG